MRNAATILTAAFLFVALILASALSSQAQNREKFVISARAGGVNVVTGRATMRPHGNSEWQLLTIKEDLETGDTVRTDRDGRVELLLNPGSYLRLGENSEFELADSSLENLEVKLIKGTAILEVTGADDDELFIGITTPHTRMSIVRRGLYRVSVVPGNTTELIVRKGRVMLDDSHTKVKGGNKVIFSGSSFSVAALTKTDKKNPDTLDGWSKDRAQTLAKANSRISNRALMALATSFSTDWSYSGFRVRSGCWLFNSHLGGYTFLPFYYSWGSPYGAFYGSSLFGYGSSCCGRGGIYNGPALGPRETPSDSIPGSAVFSPPSTPGQSAPSFPAGGGHGKGALLPGRDGPGLQRPIDQ